MKKYEAKIYWIEDIESEMTVEEISRKEMLEMMDEMLRDMRDDIEGKSLFPSDYSEDMIAILYEDGTEEVIDEGFYFDHPLNYHIKRQHIVSMTYDNAETVMTYGPYEINEWGVVGTSKTMKIDDENNIKYLRSEF